MMRKKIVQCLVGRSRSEFQVRGSATSRPTSLLDEGARRHVTLRAKSQSPPPPSLFTPHPLSHGSYSLGLAPVSTCVDLKGPN